MADHTGYRLGRGGESGLYRHPPFSDHAESSDTVLYGQTAVLWDVGHFVAVRNGRDGNLDAQKAEISE